MTDPVFGNRYGKLLFLIKEHMADRIELEKTDR